MCRLYLSFLPPPFFLLSCYLYFCLCDDSSVVVSRAMLKSFGQWFRMVVTVMMTLVLLLFPELS